MKKAVIILSSLLVVLTFAASGFSEGVKTRKIASLSAFEGSWTQVTKTPIMWSLKISDIGSFGIVSIIEKQTTGVYARVESGVFDSTSNVIYGKFSEFSIAKYELNNEGNLLVTYISREHGPSEPALFSKVK
ncbi:MAG: hypothetical protein HYW85_00355 [Deltaproteobacteria bacterium]|nr:hypothetical protein [Deltaproteobacteria bacterium]MBI3019004.1 hypothetical protein [Deltaproteobacteria bacterium]